VAGAAGASFLVDAMIARDLDVNGPLGMSVAITAGGNARVAGDITLASLTVTGTLTVPSTATSAYVSVRGYTNATYSVTTAWTTP
jgi:cytoskeletal protein CcmA (bactofilin family)